MRKKILFIPSIYRVGERIYPLIPELSKFADVDLLLIDDMQFLQGKSVQQEFCHIFNALDTSKHQIVIAGDSAPSKLEMLDDRMRSRLSGGLVAQIGPTDFDIRRGILEKKLAQK